jgi:hypothetical protein
MGQQPTSRLQLNGWSRSAQLGSGFQQARQSGMCKTQHPGLPSVLALNSAGAPDLLLT